MKFKKLTLKNFFSYGPDTEVLDLSQSGLFLIIGENGEGKSSILDGITFALFGQVTKKMNLPNIVNDKIGQDCKVTLEFEINNDTYYIERYRKYKKYNDGVFVYKNGKTKDHLISKSNKTDTQEIIENIIKFNYKSFINAVLLSQESISSFIESDPAKKKEIIENILQINIITKYHWIAQRKRQILNKEIDSLNIQITQLENSLNNVKQSMTEYIKSCKKQKKDADKKLLKYETKLKEFDNININREFELIKTSQELAKQIEQKQIIEQSLRDKLKILDNEYSNLESNIEEYNSFIDTNKTLVKKNKKELKKIQKSIDTLRNEVNEAQQNPEKCPLCKNVINEHDHKLWIQEQKEKLINLENSLRDKETQIESNTNKINEWKEKIKTLNTSLNKINKKKELINLELNKLIDDINNIEIPETKDEKELKELETLKKELEIKIDQLKNKVFIDMDYLDSLEKQAKNIEKEYKQNKKELKQKQYKYMMMEWWEQSFSSKKKSMKSWCINNVIGYFNARIKFYMDRFFDGEVELQMDTELNETIKKKNKERSFGQFSGGQKRRLNLSILFALNSLVKANISSKINIMFLDEVLSNFLDDKGVSTVLELLEEMKEKQETVFIIEHRDTFKSYPSFKTIKVQMDENEFSHINFI